MFNFARMLSTPACTDVRERATTGYKHIRGIFAIKIFHCIKLISLSVAFFALFMCFALKKDTA